MITQQQKDFFHENGCARTRTCAHTHTHTYTHTHSHTHTHICTHTHTHTPTHTHTHTQHTHTHVHTLAYAHAHAHAHTCSICDSHPSYVCVYISTPTWTRCSFVHIPDVLSEAEMQSHIDPWYVSFLKREILPEGKDLCDASGIHPQLTPEAYTVVRTCVLLALVLFWCCNYWDLWCTCTKL